MKHKQSPLFVIGAALGTAVSLQAVACSSTPTGEQAVERAMAITAPADGLIGPADLFVDGNGANRSLASCLDGLERAIDPLLRPYGRWQDFLAPTTVGGKSHFLGHKIWDAQRLLQRPDVLSYINECVGANTFALASDTIELDCSVATTQAGAPPDPSACIWIKRKRRFNVDSLAHAITFTAVGGGPIGGVLSQYANLIRNQQVGLETSDPWVYAGGSFDMLATSYLVVSALSQRINGPIGVPFPLNVASAGALAFTVDRNGEAYFSFGTNVGLAPPLSVSVNAVWAFGLIGASGPAIKSTYESWFRGTSWSLCLAGGSPDACLAHSGPGIGISSNSGIGDFGVMVGVTLPPTPSLELSWSNTTPVCHTRNDGTELKGNACVCPANSTEEGVAPAAEACVCKRGFLSKFAADTSDLAAHLFDNGLSCVPETACTDGQAKSIVNVYKASAADPAGPKVVTFVEERCPALVADEVRLFRGQTKTVQALLNDRIGTDDKIERVVCASAVTGWVNHNSDGFPDVVGRPLDTIGVKAVGSSGKHECTYTVRNSNGGKRTKSLMVDVADKYRVVTKSATYRASTDSYWACPTTTNVGYKQTNYYSNQWDGVTTFTPALSIRCPYDYVNCTAGDYQSVNGVRSTVNPADGTVYTSLYGFEGQYPGFYKWSSWSRFDEATTTVHCAAWVWGDGTSACTKPADSPISEPICNP